MRIVLSILVLLQLAQQPPGAGAAGQPVAPAAGAVNPTSALNSQPPPANAAVQVQSVWDFCLKGGPVMIPIGICSLVALAVIVERLISLRRARIIPPDLLGGLKPLLADGNGERDKALEFCRRDGSPLGAILSVGVRRLDEPPERLEQHVREAGEREVMKLRRNLRLLSLIGSIATLLGLLGTILGMIEAFQTVAASGEALGKTELLAKGIYEAMITTAAGLMVAIPVLIAGQWIAAVIDRRVLEMDELVVDFVESYALSGNGNGHGAAADSRRPETMRIDEAALRPAAAAAS